MAPPSYTPSVFVPLCGKTLDMVWLSEQGFNVVGCEISEVAAQQFFNENNIPFLKGNSSFRHWFIGT